MSFLPMKVGYLSPEGLERTAYVDRQDADGFYHGTEKHTDEPVVLVHDDEHGFREVTR